MLDDASIEQHKLAPSDEDIRAGLHKELEQGAHWFFWIAGLSLVNTGISAFGGDWNFVLGLAYTMIVDEMAAESGAAGTFIPVLTSVFIAGIFILFGLQAKKKHRWPFFAGMTLYLIDGLIFVLAQVWLAVAIHGLALYYLYKGLSALNQLRKMEALTVPGLSQVKLD